jgi:hypothetical protein
MRSVGLSLISFTFLVSAGCASAAEAMKGTAVAPGLLTHVPVPGSIATRRNPVQYVPLRTKDPEALARGKRAAQARAAQSSKEPAEESISPSPALNAGKNKPGIPSDGTVTPPDSTGSIGPKHYIEMVNAQVAVYNRKLRKKDQVDLDTFVGKPDDGQCDPQIQWDPQANRWFYAALDCDGGTSNFLLFGWSKNDSPLPLPSGSSEGNWCRFQLSTTNLLDDYPKLGHNDTFMIIGTNVFDGATLAFQTARLWAIPKPANNDDTCALPAAAFSWGSPDDPLKTADGDFAFTPVPANTISGGPNAYVTAADFAGSGSADQLMVWHISGPATAPVLTEDGNINVQSYRTPAGVPQPGTTNLLDSSDTRLTQSVAAKDGKKLAIWTQHTVDSNSGRSVVRWYEIVPSKCRGGSCPARALKQSGEISSKKHFAFNGAVSPTRAGNSAAIQFNLGSGTLLAEIHAQSRVGGDPLGTMSGDVTLGTSTHFDQDFSCSPCRWGDYAALNPDPNNTTTVWGTNMGLGDPDGTAPHWTTRNFSLKP